MMKLVQTSLAALQSTGRDVQLMGATKKLTYSELCEQRLSEERAGKRSNRFPLIAIVEHVRSLYNVGSIFRTSDGAHLEAIYTVGYTPHPPRKEIDKTALGATKTVPHQHFETVAEAIEAARNGGYHIAALEIASSSRSIYALQPEDFPLAIVIGNELTGVSDEAIGLSDWTLEIPMLGTKHSLNVAVAFGIAAFECVRVFHQELQRFS